MGADYSAWSRFADETYYLGTLGIVAGDHVAVVDAGGYGLLASRVAEDSGLSVFETDKGGGDLGSVAAYDGPVRVDAGGEGSGAAGYGNGREAAAGVRRRALPAPQEALGQVETLAAGVANNGPTCAQPGGDGGVMGTKTQAEGEDDPGRRAEKYHRGQRDIGIVSDDFTGYVIVTGWAQKLAELAVVTGFPK